MSGEDNYVKSTEMELEELEAELRKAIQNSPNTNNTIDVDRWNSKDINYERTDVSLSSERETILQANHPLLDYFGGFRELDIGINTGESKIRENYPFRNNGSRERIGNKVEVSRIDASEAHEFSILGEGYISLDEDIPEEGELYNLEIREFIEGRGQRMKDGESLMEIHSQIYQDNSGDLYLTHWDPGIWNMENETLVKKKLKHKDGFFHMANPPEDKHDFSDSAKFIDNNTYSINDGLKVISELTIELSSKLLASHREKYPIETDVFNSEPLVNSEKDVEKRNSAIIEKESPISYSEIMFGWSESENRRVDDSEPAKVINAVRWAALGQTANYLAESDISEFIKEF